MEPTIKYESCEDTYISPNDTLLAGQKRHFDYLAHTDDYDDGFQNFKDPFLTSSNYSYNAFGQKLKRVRRGESAVLFAPPFFEVPEDYKFKGGDTIMARCVSCQVMLRGHKNVSSNFLKHMKRAHPQMHNMYETYKLLKQQGLNPPKPTMPFLSSTATSEGRSLLHANVTHTTKENDSEHFETYENDQGNSNTSSMSNTSNPNNTMDNVTSNIPSSVQNQNQTHGDNVPPQPEVNRSNQTPQAMNQVFDNAPPQTEVNMPNQTLQAMSRMFDNAPPQPEVNMPNQTLQAMSRMFDNAPQQPEVNLSNQTLQAMSRMFDEKLKSFATKSELNEVTRNIMNKVCSRQTTPCSTIGGVDGDEDDVDTDFGDEKFRILERELHHMREQLAQSEHSKRILQRELHLLEKVVRRRKLVISNLPMAPNQTPKAAVDQLLKERFGLSNVMLESAYVVGNRNRPPNSDRQTVLVEVVHESDVNMIFKKASCLRNTGIYIESQMSQISIKRKEKLMVLRREMLRRNGSLKILVRNTHLMVCDTYFHWDDLLGLCMGNLDMGETEVISGDEAVEELRKLTNLDMKEFLNVLKNYDIK